DAEVLPTEEETEPLPGPLAPAPWRGQVRQHRLLRRPPGSRPACRNVERGPQRGRVRRLRIPPPARGAPPDPAAYLRRGLGIRLQGDGHRQPHGPLSLVAKKRYMRGPLGVRGVATEQCRKGLAAGLT